LGISIINYRNNFKVNREEKLKQWAKKVIEKLGKKEGEITIVFTNDEYLFELNKDFLGKNYYTDVITFDYSESPEINGDIIISLCRVDENSKSFQVSFNNELDRVIVHGLLHLAGYKDSTSEEQSVMRKMEDRFLNM